jgi:hypothetical protein
MRLIHRRAAAAAWLALTLAAAVFNSSRTQAGALDLQSLTGSDAAAGLKTALTQGAQKAVASLGKTDGFLGNAEVRIPLPGKLQKAEKTLRMLGLGKDTDQFITAMNRAAEAAVPEAKPLLINAVKQMSVADAKGILSGGSDAATQYFRRTTSAKLTEKFLPVVQRTTAKVELAKRYNSLAGKLEQFGLVDKGDSTIESYVTAKALDGLFLMMAKEEAAIRANPVGQASQLLRHVFGAAASH